MRYTRGTNTPLKTKTKNGAKTQTETKRWNNLLHISNSSPRVGKEGQSLTVGWKTHASSRSLDCDPVLFTKFWLLRHTVEMGNKRYLFLGVLANFFGTP